MRTVRTNVFETNSSSTHSIAIPLDKHVIDRGHVYFAIEEYGWEYRQPSPASYLYTAILCYYGKDKARDKIEYLQNVLNKNGIDYDMDDPKWTSYTWDDKIYWSLDNGYIDHPEGLEEFLNAVFANDNTLLDFIFGGLVFTGNDNCDEDQACYTDRKTPTYESYENGYMQPPVIKNNPYYMPDHANYDWYYKGN